MLLLDFVYFCLHLLDLCLLVLACFALFGFARLGLVQSSAAGLGSPQLGFALGSTELGSALSPTLGLAQLSARLRSARLSGV